MRSDYSRVERAIQFLSKETSARTSLNELARFLGLSPFHAHRLFKRWAGITPKDFLQLAALTKARKQLARAETILSASYGSGLSGSSRLHDLFIRLEAMTPGEYKNAGSGLEITWGIFESPIGRMAVATTKRGVCFASFSSDPGKIRAELKNRWPKARLIRSPEKTQGIAKVIFDRMKGTGKDPLSLWVKGTPFQIKVWEALLRIPEGETATYRNIA